MYRIIFFLALLLFSLSTLALPNKGFFSEENLNALKNDPISLFSAVNTCRIRSVLGQKDFDLFSEAMDQMSIEDDAPGFVSIAGNAKGLSTVYEGFMRISNSGKVWAAYLYEKKIHYFTNDEASYKQPPKIILDWASRFKGAKWVDNLLIVKAVICSKLQGKVAEHAKETKVFTCNKHGLPTVMKSIKDYDIVASNTATISASQAFKGEEIIYAVSAKPTNKKNKVSIDSETGDIQIDAQAKDKFDVKVTAKNICGEVSTTFNVVIDEEK